MQIILKADCWEDWGGEREEVDGGGGEEGEGRRRRRVACLSGLTRSVDAE